MNAMQIRSHIKTSTEARMLAVWSNEANTYRLEVGKGLSGYTAFRFSGGRLIVHHSGMTINEATNLVAGWLKEVGD